MRTWFSRGLVANLTSALGSRSRSGAGNDLSIEMAVNPAIAANGLTYIPAISGARGVAVLLVIIFHADFLSGGFIGVDIFFCLSGFLITSLLLQEHASTGTINFKRFYARRLLRLGPALIFLLLVYRIVMPHLVEKPVGSWNIDVLIPLFYSTNWFRAFEHWRAPILLGHTWSLSVEEQFYAIEPLLIFMLLQRWPRKLAWTLAFFATVSLTLRVTMVLMGTSLYRICNGFDTRMDSLFLGALAAALLSKQASREALRRHARLFSDLALCFIVAIAVFANYTNLLMLSFGYTAVALAATLLIVRISTNTQGRLMKVLEYGPLVWLGTISYGLYLWHAPIFRLMTLRGYPPISVLLFGGSITLAFATLSYYLIELPFLKLKSRFGSNSSGAGRPEEHVTILTKPS